MSKRLIRLGVVALVLLGCVACGGPPSLKPSGTPTSEKPLTPPAPPALPKPPKDAPRS